MEGLDCDNASDVVATTPRTRFKGQEMKYKKNYICSYAFEIISCAVFIKINIVVIVEF